MCLARGLSPVLPENVIKYTQFQLPCLVPHWNSLWFRTLGPAHSVHIALTVPLRRGGCKLIGLARVTMSGTTKSTANRQRVLRICCFNSKSVVLHSIAIFLRLSIRLLRHKSHRHCSAHQAHTHTARLAVPWTCNRQANVATNRALRPMIIPSVVAKAHRHMSNFQSDEYTERATNLRDAQTSPAELFTAVFRASILFERTNVCSHFRSRQATSPQRESRDGTDLGFVNTWSHSTAKVTSSDTAIRTMLRGFCPDSYSSKCLSPRSITCLCSCGILKFITKGPDHGRYQQSVIH